MKKSILVFPAGMPRSIAYLRKLMDEGVAVVGSSSLAFDPSRELYPAWVHLPYVTAPEFDQALARAIAQHDIGGIYTPNIVVWDHLDKVLQDIAPGVRLVNASPIEEVLAQYQTALKQAHAVGGSSLQIASELPAKRPLTEIEVASLYRHANSIPGMCDDDKLRALLEIFRYSVAGDVVEIGSWWGKSAFVLARLAQSYGIGKLLCVDPWSNEHLVQGEAMVDSSSAQVDANDALRIFQMNLWPYGFGQVNYLRMPSVQGARCYRNGQHVETDVFGSTDFDGRISILHIDGNHAYHAVKSDIVAWCDLVVAGGWIVIDDYIWPYGNGPRRAGDEFLRDHVRHIEVAFAIGSALFIQLSSQIG